MPQKRIRRSKAEHLIIVEEARVRRNMKERENKDRCKKNGHATMRLEQEILMSTTWSKSVRRNTTNKNVRLNNDVLEAVIIVERQPNVTPSTQFESKSPSVKGVHTSEHTTSNVCDTLSMETASELGWKLMLRVPLVVSYHDNKPTI